MRRILLIVLVAGCKPGGVSNAQETCAKAAAMFDRCEDFGDTTKLARDLAVDRWRGMCRATFTGETKQLMPNALEVYQSLDDNQRMQLRAQAECTAQATTCDAYRACEK